MKELIKTNMKLFRANQELLKLQGWFTDYFDKQVVESIWQKDFKPSKDPVSNLTYNSMDKLYAKAEEYRSRIKELRNIIAVESKKGE